MLIKLLRSSNALKQTGCENSNPKKIIIFGENHTKTDEVDEIREQVIKMNPEVILHELYWEDEKFYTNKIPNVIVLPLERDPPTSGTLKEKFALREAVMIENMNKAVSLYRTIAIVVGDTHLRNSTTKELGNASPLNRWARSNSAVIRRSNYREID